jgi:hypothetical protein
MKTTKSSLFNVIIVCSIAVNLAAISTLCYIASVDSKVDRISAALLAPVCIYTPKTVASSMPAILVESASTK